MTDGREEEEERARPPATLIGKTEKWRVVKLELLGGACCDRSDGANGADSAPIRSGRDRDATQRTKFFKGESRVHGFGRLRVKFGHIGMKKNRRAALFAALRGWLGLHDF